MKVPNMIFAFLVVSATVFAQRVAVSKETPLQSYKKGVSMISTGETERGLGYVRLAAGKGYIEAQLYLAKCYEEGKIVKLNYSEAGHWYELAAKQGDPNAARRLQTLVDDGRYAPAIQNVPGSSSQQVVINYQFNQNTVNNSPTSLTEINIEKSDVDIEIPTNTVENNNTIVVIIANENYQEESKVEYANNDGESFKEYCNKTLGIPENHIHLRKDATLNNILSELNWLQQLTNTPKFKDQSSVIFYYAGHGIPDEASGTSYLLPIDGRGNMINTAYSIPTLYKSLGNLPVKKVIVFMDACFSGTKRGEGMLASARGVAIKAKSTQTTNNMVVFSAAKGEETAYPYKSKQHGLFTYFILKKLKETNGQCTLGELNSYIYENVTSVAIEENGKSQTPTVSSPNASWQQEKLIFN